jgi:hypothetical protein
MEAGGKYKNPKPLDDICCEGLVEDYVKHHKLDSLKCDGFYLRNVYSLLKDDKEAKKLPMVDDKATKIYYTIDLSVNPGLAELTKKLKALCKTATRYVGCDPGSANLMYFQELIPDHPGSSNFAYGNRWRYTRGEDLAHRRA